MLRNHEERKRIFKEMRNLAAQLVAAGRKGEEFTDPKSLEEEEKYNVALFLMNTQMGEVRKALGIKPFEN